MCTIKKSLTERLNASKTFVLIVGENTDKLTKGSCRYCQSYNSYTSYCARGNRADNRSYIDFECEKAVRDNLRIVVIYNFTSVRKDKCPQILRNMGTHIPCYALGTDGKYHPNYYAVRRAIMGY